MAVVLCEFQDVKMKPGTKERMEELFFSTGKLATGSVTEYYKEVSNGKVAFTGEVFGPYQLSQNLSYYTNNGKESFSKVSRVALTNSEYGWNEQGPNARNMADEAFEAVKKESYGKDWKVYDNDANGYVDAFICVHAGPAVSFW